MAGEGVGLVLARRVGADHKLFDILACTRIVAERKDGFATVAQSKEVELARLLVLLKVLHRA